VRVPVEISTRAPHSSAGTSKRKGLPVPVPASTTGLAYGERAGYAFRHDSCSPPHLEIRQRPLEGPAVTRNILKINMSGSACAKPQATILARVEGRSRRISC